MLQDDLLKSGVPADHIISMRYTSEDFDDWFNPQKVDKKKEKKYNRSKQASRKTSRRKNK